MNMSQFIKLFT